MEVSNGTLADEFMLDFEEEDAAPVPEEEEDVAVNVAVSLDLDNLPTNLRTTPRFLSVMQEMEQNSGEAFSPDSFSLISKANELAADVVEHQLRVAKYTK